MMLGLVFEAQKTIASDRFGGISMARIIAEIQVRKSLAQVFQLPYRPARAVALFRNVLKERDHG
jgi:hypothetical protein